MRTAIMLAVDVAPGEPLRHVRVAVDIVRALVRDDADRVIVMHVREFSLPKLARTMQDHGCTSGRRVVDAVVPVSGRLVLTRTD